MIITVTLRFSVDHPISTIQADRLEESFTVTRDGLVFVVTQTFTDRSVGDAVVQAGKKLRSILGSVDVYQAIATRYNDEPSP